ncbi:MAG: T9SS type A sorting domain-containing protein [Bacteroidota bacterium]
MKFFNIGFIACLLATTFQTSILYGNNCSSATSISLGGCQTIAFDAVCDFSPASQIACTSPVCQGDAWFEFVPGGTNASQFDVQFDISVDVANTINVVLIYSESVELGDPCEWPSGAEGYTRHGSVCTEVVSAGVPFDFTVRGMDGSGTFFLLVERVTGTGGNVTVCPTLLGNCPAPSNDRCSNAQPLTSGSGIDPNAATGPAIPNWNDALKSTNACATKQRLTDFCSLFTAGTPTEDHYTRKLPGVCYHNGNIGDNIFPGGVQCDEYLENTVYYSFQVPVSANDWYLHLGSTSQCTQQPNNLMVTILSSMDCADADLSVRMECTKTAVFGGIPSADWSSSAMNLNSSNTYYIVIDGTRQSQCDFCLLLGRGPANPVLPVEFLSFQGFQQETGHLLEWTTKTEDGISSFTVERSLDSETFETIGSINSLGSIDQGLDYQFLDESAPVGGSYYRITTLDINGVESSSEIIYLERVLPGPQLFRLYPNPASDQLHLFLGIPEQASASFSLTDMWGRTVHQEMRQLHSGNQEQVLDVNTFARGLYILRIRIGKEVLTKKILLN